MVRSKRAGSRASGVPPARVTSLFVRLSVFVAAFVLTSPAFAAPTVIVGKGDSWESLAERHYGSAAYAKVLADFNKSAGKKAKARAKVEVPPLDAGFAQYKFDARFEGLLRELGSVGVSLVGISQELRPSDAGAQLPTPLVMRIRAGSSKVDLVRSALVSTVERMDPPPVALKELDAAVVQLNDLALGRSVDVQRIHKHLADAMLEIMRWYRAGFH